MNTLSLTALSHNVQSFWTPGQVRARSCFTYVSGLSRCFGFATMEDSGQADAVIQALEGSQLDGKSIHIEKVRQKDCPLNR